MKKLKNWFCSPRFRYSALSTVILLIFLTILILLNSIFTQLEKRNGWRVDLSFNALTTQSETTLQILDALPHPVHIYALFSRGQEDAPLEELLDRYAAASPLVTWEQTDPSLNPGLLTRFRGSTEEETVTNDSLIVYCEETDRFRILSPGDFLTLSLNYEEGIYQVAGLRYESAITSALDYVSRDVIPRVLFLQGHGELDPATVQTLEQLLTDNHYQVEYLSLAAREEPLDPQDLVVMLSPVRDLMDRELELLTTFAGAGGKLLFTCDYTDPVSSMPNYQALLRSYGFLPMEGIVVASAKEPGTFYNNMRIDLLPTMQSTDMTLPLLSAGADVLLLTGSRAFEQPGDTDRNLTVSTILTSGEQAYLRDLSGGSLSLEKAETDPSGPFALALQSQRITTEGYVSKAVILGSSPLLTSAQIHSMTDAQEFILTVVKYLFGETAPDLSIMAKEAFRPQLSAASADLGTLILVLLPTLVLAAALLVLLPRRHR